MIIFFVLLIPVFALLLWAFFRFSPAVPERGPLRLYNFAIVALALGISVAYAWYLHGRMDARGQPAAWLPLAALFSLLISSGVLAVGGVLRNFVLFGAPEATSDVPPPDAHRRRVRKSDRRSRA